MHFFNSNIKLLRTRQKRTQSDVAVSLNLKRTTINALENSISQPTVIQLQAFSKYFGIAIDTLINTNLQKLSESQFTDLQNGFDVFIKGSNIRVIATTVNSNNEENIEFVNEKAKAGYTSGFADAEFIQSLPVFHLPFLSKEKKYRAFSISGDSMLPIPSGSVVLGEFILNFNEIVSGKAYIVVTREDGVVFKIVKNRIKEKKALILSSLNPFYKPFELPVTEIREVWKFVNYINNEIPEAHTDMDCLMKELSDLKREVSEIKTKL
ncbi:MAG: helix-turn-helix transcriptional regulator [Prolixibacteraceae bacterium]|nr:helix-turn-helix transcriptional regulator [Prolixibacteraceae bacterium]MBN2775225.1 helix-turn-helix transcriptional regulator [Prolixibacteraceae bacterium]